jgi:tRNA nucleotidyltransferase (CCA-adding enzyme)
MISPALLKKVLARITPSEEERVVEEKMVHALLKKIKSLKGPHIGAILAGSLARNTHLKGDRDFDIFVFYSPTLSRKKFEVAGLKMGHSVFDKSFHEEAYSEHPYVRGVIDGFNVEIVPAYQVNKAAEKLSAVDRTPFHAAYMRKHLSPVQQGEVRLLKQFLKGIGVYGADVKMQGVPGYLVEILILQYGSFEKALEGISAWRDQNVIDIAGHYPAPSDASSSFQSPFFLVVDPTDKSRNVAGALSYNQFARMILASRTFLEKPSEHFFFGKPRSHLSKAQVKSYFSAEELVGIHLPYPPNLLSDVAWGQLQRLTKKLSHGLSSHSFSVCRSFHWTDGLKDAVILLEVDNPLLQKSQTRTGPKVVEARHCTDFLKAHPSPLSGPRVEEGRIVLEVQRKITHAADALLNEAKKSALNETSGWGKMLLRAKPLSESQILSLFSKNTHFAFALSVFLKGKEPFL